MAQRYNIRKVVRKNMKTVGYLSRQKKRWLPANSVHLRALMTEKEADDFVQSKTDDKDYYYFKIWAI